MKKLICVGVLAALALTMGSTEAQAFGRRKKNKNCCQAPAATTSCCGGMTGYAGMYGQPMYATLGGTTTYAQMPGTMAMPMATTGNVVTASATSPAAAGRTGTITIMVPSADAQVWFEDTALPQTGKERTFSTPALTDGKTYNYTVKAKWTGDNGKAMEKSLPVSVRAGQTSTVDFR